MSDELMQNIFRAETFIDEYDAQEKDFICTVIETSDDNNCVFLRQSILGWVDSLYIVPGTISRYGAEWLIETINNVFAASAVKISHEVLQRYIGDVHNEY